MSTRILILKDGVITPAKSSSDVNNAGVVDLTNNQTIGGIKNFSGSFALPTTIGTTIGTVWRNVDTLEYKDSSNVTKIILNSAGNLSNLSNKQLSLNNLVGTQTANRLLRSDGTNVTLSQIGLTTDVTGVLSIANGGTNSSTQNFVDLTTTQSIAGNKTFNSGLVLPAIVGTSIGTIWRNVDNLEYKDSTNVTRVILSSAGNLNNLSNRQTALNNLSGAVTTGTYLRGNGTDVLLSTIQVGDIPTLNQNTIGTASNITGVLNLLNGGTGATTQQTAINALVGTQTANRVLRSNGTNMSLAQVGLTTDVIGTLPIANGGTNSSTQNFVDLTTTQTIAGAKTLTASLTLRGDVGIMNLFGNTDNYNTFRFTASINTVSSYWDIGVGPSSLNRDFYISSGYAGGGFGFRLDSLNYNLALSTTTEATSTTTGGLVLNAGLGLGKNLFAGGKICPVASPAVNWGIDYTTGGSTISLVAGGTYDLATGSGMVVIYDDGDASYNFMFVSGGGVVSVSSNPSSSLVAGSPPSDKVGLFYNGGTAKYRISNNRTTTRTLIISTIKMRAAS